MLKKSQLDKIITKDLLELLPGNIVYKYASFDVALEKIILEKTLKFCNPSLFNDPFDCNECLLDIVMNEADIRKMLKLYYPTLSTPTHDHLVKKAQSDTTMAETFLKQKENFRISCFSKIPNEVLMWSHYADKHSGICIGFKFPFKYEEKFILSNVKYVPSMKPLDGNSATEKVFLYWLTTKSKRWEYEKEVRAITKGKSPSGYEIVEFDGKLINEIIFGCNVNSEKIQRTVKVLQNEFPKEQRIQFKKMTIDPKTFLLKCEEV